MRGQRLPQNFSITSPDECVNDEKEMNMIKKKA
jgi:hypothetical protein